jgi:hypothetical protein
MRRTGSFILIKPALGGYGLSRIFTGTRLGGWHSKDNSVKGKSLYLKFLLHLLHHINFEITAAVHLAKISGKKFPNAHVSVISNVKSDLTTFQVLFFGRTLG